MFFLQSQTSDVEKNLSLSRWNTFGFYCLMHYHATSSLCNFSCQKFYWLPWYLQLRVDMWWLNHSPTRLLRGLGSRCCQVTVLCYWTRYFTLTMPLSIQGCQWVPANCQGKLTKCLPIACDGQAFHPGREG